MAAMRRKKEEENKLNGRRIAGTACILTAVVMLAVVIKQAAPHLEDYYRSWKNYKNLQDTFTKPPESESGNEAEQENAAGSADGTETRTESETDGRKKDDKIKKLSEGERLAKKYPCIKVDSAGLKKRNPDYAGWIYVPGTDISYPVVIGKEGDPYLHKAFDGSYSYSGTIFFDKRNGRAGEDYHSILYGHNMRNGSMFAQIKSYADRKFAKKHPVFWYVSDGKAALYEVFSAYTANPQDFDVTYSVDGEQFFNSSDFDKIVEKIAEKSATDFDVKVHGTDRVMSLSTCTNEHVTRFTVHGKLILEKSQKE